MKKRPMTVVIKNCKVFSFAWWHEQRHAWQEEKHGLLSAYCVVDELLKFALMLSLVFRNWLVTGFLITAMFLIHVGLEWDADLYALRKTGDWRSWLRLKGVDE